MAEFKYNWGWGILFSIIIFLLIMAAIIIFAMNKNVDLVTKNYYQKELEYQSQIDKENKSKFLNKDVIISKDKKNITIIFPDSIKITGELNFYRPSDSKLDFKIPIKLTVENKQIINTKFFAKGFWKVKINWEENNNDFYSEKSFVVQ